MIRPHIHVNVADMDASVSYYTTLFGVGPNRRTTDYAQWRLEDPAVNLALSMNNGAPGVQHVGLDFASPEDLTAPAARLDARDGVQPETCCYARSQKLWSRDPDGVVWELFHTTDRDALVPDGHGEALSAPSPRSACCDGA